MTNPDPDPVPSTSRNADPEESGIDLAFDVLMNLDENPDLSAFMR